MWHAHAQVLRRYGEYGDAVLGRFGEKEGGAVRYPSVRVVAKPLLGLFHNTPGLAPPQRRLGRVGHGLGSRMERGEDIDMKMKKKQSGP